MQTRMVKLKIVTEENLKKKNFCEVNSCFLEKLWFSDVFSGDQK